VDLKAVAIEEKEMTEEVVETEEVVAEETNQLTSRRNNPSIVSQ
jgi:hypothetical protein